MISFVLFRSSNEQYSFKVIFHSYKEKAASMLKIMHSTTISLHCSHSYCTMLRLNLTCYKISVYTRVTLCLVTTWMYTTLEDPSLMHKLYEIFQELSVGQWNDSVGKGACEVGLETIPRSLEPTRRWRENWLHTVVLGPSHVHHHMLTHHSNEYIKFLNA